MISIIHLKISLAITISLLGSFFSNFPITNSLASSERQTLSSLSLNIFNEQPDIKFSVCDSDIDIPDYECQILIDLYEATDGANWLNNDGWLISNNVNDWYGITVKDGYVSLIDLSANNLSGLIPDTLGNLSNLENLNLAGNQLSGSIPESIGNLTNLQFLILGMNQLSGQIPNSIGDLYNLREIYLPDNQLSGSIPESIGNLSNLIGITLAGNQLSGSLPVSLGNLYYLKYLQIQQNNFSGNIPESISNLTDLIIIALAENQLSGSLPESIGNISNLEYLYLNNNNFSGSVPLSFVNLTALDVFYFYDTFLCELDSSEYISWKETLSEYLGTDDICKFIFLPLLHK